jgi:hypothetical protein
MSDHGQTADANIRPKCVIVTCDKAATRYVSKVLHVPGSEGSTSIQGLKTPYCEEHAPHGAIRL